jgi:hypothetical protein
MDSSLSRMSCPGSLKIWPGLSSPTAISRKLSLHYSPNRPWDAGRRDAGTPGCPGRLGRPVLPLRQKNLQASAARFGFRTSAFSRISAFGFRISVVGRLGRRDARDGGWDGSSIPESPVFTGLGRRDGRDVPFYPFAERKRISSLRRPVRVSALDLLSDFGLRISDLCSGTPGTAVGRQRDGSDIAESPAFTGLGRAGRVGRLDLPLRQKKRIWTPPGTPGRLLGRRKYDSSVLDVRRWMFDVQVPSGRATTFKAL